MVGASEVSPPEEVGLTISHGQRWIEVQLVGESYGQEGFQRGVSVFPTIDDEVHIVTEDDLNTIYATPGISMVDVGYHSASENLRALVDLDKVVTRHAAIVGSTGSGKSNTVAGFLKKLTKNNLPNSRVVVIDPHGEYSTAFQDCCRVFRINDPDNPLYVPYWALSFDELMWFLVDRRTTSESMQDSAIRSDIFKQKRDACSGLKAGSLTSGEITVDSPVPFNIRKLWYDFYIKENATLMEKDNWDKIAYKEDSDGNEIKGDLDTLTPPQFCPPGTGPIAPFKSPQQKGLGSYLNKIHGRLKDRRFDFLLSPGNYDGTISDLDDLLSNWIDHDHAITILDLSGIPFEVIDLVVGVLTRILFEGMFWGRDLPGLGRQRPLLIVFEEAHTYLPRGGSSQFVTGYASNAVRRIFKEGRKYGVGSIVVSQRPSELDETILSQCGTFFALRLSNSEDQGRVRSAIQDTLAGLIDLLPALRTGEALILGEAIQIPSRVRLPLIEPRPKSDDPEVSKRWAEDKVERSHYDEAITGWRRQHICSNAGSPEEVKK